MVRTRKNNPRRESGDSQAAICGRSACWIRERKTQTQKHAASLPAIGYILALTIFFMSFRHVSRVAPDSNDGNLFRAYPAYATMTDAAHSFYHYARGFRSVTATGAEDTASGDRAWLYDSPVSDTLAAAFWDDLAGKYTGGFLTDEVGGDPATGSYRNAFRYFDLVYARSSDGQANDTIDVVDWELLAYRVIWAGEW